MEDKKSMNIVVAVIICLVLIGVLIFISINNKTNKEDMSLNTNNNPSGLVDETIPVTGEVAKAGDVVSVNYTGRLKDGTAFDSNIDPKFGHAGELLTFTLGAGQMISGFDKGVVGMKVGEKKTLVLPPEEAYGDKGAGPIPPNATLTFEVELISIKK